MTARDRALEEARHTFPESEERADRCFAAIMRVAAEARREEAEEWEREVRDSRPPAENAGVKSAFERGWLNAIDAILRRRGAKR